MCVFDCSDSMYLFFLEHISLVLASLFSCLLDSLALLSMMLASPKIFSRTILMICSYRRLSPGGLSRGQLFKLLGFFFVLLSPTFLQLYVSLSVSLSRVLIFRANRTSSRSLACLSLSSLSLHLLIYTLHRSFSLVKSRSLFLLNFTPFCALSFLFLDGILFTSLFIVDSQSSLESNR